MPHYSKILIANRGEIAVRIARTARAQGYRTVAIYSEADAGSPHIDAADEAVCIGPAPATESYLSIDQVLGAARLTGADAVHPGYGFLSENADFARRAGEAGLVFIGPTPEAISAMGSKSEAKALVEPAGVPCLPGYRGAAQDDDTLLKEAERIGLPLMVKAAAGGGGRGMRLVTSEKALPQALKTARSEAERAFGSPELLLERAVVGGRHVEIQVLADTHGHTVHLGERDCSIQRRHQKVIEESPCPVLDPNIRAAMGEAAVAAARSVGYVGAGTVEFLLEADGRFWFLEMNTRLQVEHPVTEMVTGLDLVEWQLRIAAGEHLTLEQEDIRLNGHAFELRLYAEDPRRKFLPQTGTLQAWRPPEGEGIRVDAALCDGYVVSPYYDPMLAKLITYGRDRETARRRAVQALSELSALGLVTNKSFLLDALQHPVFIEGKATTAFIDEHMADSAKPADPPPHLQAVAALLLSVDDPTRPAGLRSTSPPVWPVRMTVGRETVTAEVQRNGRGFAVAVGERSFGVTVHGWSGRDRLTVSIDNVRRRITALRRDGTLHLDGGDGAWTLELATMSRAADADAGGEAKLIAPMSGRVVTLSVASGGKVKKGQIVAVVEAMKMQHEITAPRDGEIATVDVVEGDQVAPRQTLITLAALAG